MSTIIDNEKCIVMLSDLFAALERYAKAHGLRIHRWERCVTLEYAGSMFADIGSSVLLPDRSIFVPVSIRMRASGFRVYAFDVVSI